MKGGMGDGLAMAISSVPYDASIGPVTESLWGCTIGRRPLRRDLGFAAGLVALGMLVRRRRIRTRRAPSR
jgi:hypothetical protein